MHMEPPEAAPTMEILGVVLYPPGHPPIQVDGARVLITRVEGGITVVGTLNSDGQHVTYVGMAYQLITQQNRVVVPRTS
jgi:hypothetical protein